MEHIIIDWSAVAAIGTLLAVIVAIGTSVATVWYTNKGNRKG